MASTFSEEIGAMLEGELSDPRIAPSYVTDVVLAPGGKSARVFVAVHGSASEEESTLAGLMTARAFIRSQIRDRVRGFGMCRSLHVCDRPLGEDDGAHG